MFHLPSLTLRQGGLFPLFLNVHAAPLHFFPPFFLRALLVLAPTLASLYPVTFVPQYGESRLTA